MKPVKLKLSALSQVESAPRLITAASPDSPLTRELDKHQSGGAHNKSGVALIGLEYLVEIKEVSHSLCTKYLRLTFSGRTV